eukprot:scaffold184_cov316-Pinguiococcus_pyrenoidosus.AAC.17
MPQRRTDTLGAMIGIVGGRGLPSRGCISASAGRSRSRCHRRGRLHGCWCSAVQFRLEQRTNRAFELQSL